MAQETVAKVLARYVLGMRYENLPPRVVALAKDCILDQLGVQLRGATLPWTQPVYRVVQNLKCNGGSTVVFHGTKTAPAYAAYVNSTFGHSCEMDDQGVGTHAGSIVVAPSIALGEIQGTNGKELIRAVVAGYEAMGRVALARTEENRGFHMIDAPFAAATSAGILLGLDEDTLVQAYGIAGDHSGGVTEYDQAGGEVKRLHAGLASRGGVQSAELAKEGLTAPATIFEGKRGVVQAFRGPEADAQSIIKGLGKDDYQIMHDIFKFYSGNINIHSALDALNALMTENKIDHRAVREIRVGKNSNLAHYATIVRPTDVLGAHFSLAFAIALRLVTGKTDRDYLYFDDYLDPRKWVDPDILRVVDTVKPYVIPEAAGDLKHLCRMEIKLADGRTLRREERYCTGSPQKRHTPAQLEAKFRMLASAAIPKRRMDQVLEMVRNLEQVSNVSQLTALLVK